MKQYPNVYRTLRSNIKNSRKCNSINCKLCPIMKEYSEKIAINGREVTLNGNITCRSESIIVAILCPYCQIFWVQYVDSVLQDYFTHSLSTPCCKSSHIIVIPLHKCFSLSYKICQQMSTFLVTYLRNCS